FFFQAEDGIRDFHVTGVQTCALPICCRSLCQTRLVRVLTTSRRISNASRSQLLPGYWITATFPITWLSYYSDLDCMSRWVVDSKIIGELADNRPCIFRTFGFDVHP